MAVVRLTKKTIDERCLPGPRPQSFYWDSEVKGFGVCVGRPNSSGRIVKTFIIQRQDKRSKIGRYGDWTLEQARARARELVVAVDRGEDLPAQRKRNEALSLTVRQAMEDHIRRLKAKGGSNRSEVDIRYCFDHYLADWMDRPLVSISREECRTRHRQMKPYAGNRTMRNFRAAWNSAVKVHDDLPAVSPTISIEWNREKRVQAPLRWEDLPKWKQTVEGLGPVRKDYLFTVLLTGLRSEDCATIKWADVDLETGTLHRPTPKGGRPFTVPIAQAVVNILKHRCEENRILFGDDEGLVFPGRNHEGKIQPLTERRWGPKRCSPHRLRDTFITACHECGVPEMDYKTLVNHRLPGGDVTAGYIRQSVEHLRSHVEKVTAFLLGKMGG